MAERGVPGAGGTPVRPDDENSEEEAETEQGETSPGDSFDKESDVEGGEGDEESYGTESDGITEPSFVAAAMGNAELLQKLIQEGADVNQTRTPLGVTPLLLACQNGHPNTAQILIQHGADVNAMTRNGLSVLFFAVDSRRVSLVKLLINKGAVVDSENGEQKITPLFLAVAKGSKKIVMTLLENKADPNKATLDKMVTPFNLACRRGSEAIVSMLLEYGAKPTRKTRNKLSPLFLAAEGGYEDVVALLLEVPEIDVNDKNGKHGVTALHVAARNGDTGIVRLLVENNAKVDPVSKTARFTPLHNACRRGHAKAAALLLLKGAKIGRRTAKNNTPLFCATNFAQKEVVRLLLQNGAKVNAVNGDKNVTALYIACLQGYEEMVVDLLAAGADSNIVSKDTYATALNAAVRNGHTEVVRLLLKSGADHRLLNINGYSPLYIAAEFDHDDIMKCLVAEGADVNQVCGQGGFSPIYIACKRGHVYCAELLVRAGADVNVFSKHKHLSALTGACRNGRYPCVELLLKNGADITGRTEKGFTSMFVAAEFGHKHIVQLFLDHGADANETSGPHKLSALHIAAEAGHMACVKVLLKHGANVNQLCKAMNTTALLFACDQDKGKVATKLLQSGADANIKNRRGQSALFLAARTGAMDAVKALIEESKGALELDAPNGKSGVTALGAAIMENFHDVAMFLLKSGASPNIKLKHTYPLNEAARLCDLATVTGLLGAGANVDPVSDKGYTPLLNACSENCYPVAKCLIEAGANVNYATPARGITPLFAACGDGDLGLVSLLLEAGADPNAKTKRGYSSLFLAAEYGNASVVKVLIEAGADVNYLNGPRRLTALFIAQRNDTRECEALLKTANAKVVKCDLPETHDALASGDDSGDTSVSHDETTTGDSAFSRDSD